MLTSLPRHCQEGDNAMGTNSQPASEGLYIHDSFSSDEGDVPTTPILHEKPRQR